MNNLNFDTGVDHVAPAIPSPGSGPQSSADNPKVPAKPDEDIGGLIEDHILPKLDPEFLQYFSKHQVPAPGLDISIEQVRAQPEAYQPPCALDTSAHPRVSNSSFVSQDNARIPVRIYHPDPAKHGTGPYPAHLNFHGESTCVCTEPRILSHSARTNSFIKAAASFSETWILRAHCVLACVKPGWWWSTSRIVSAQVLGPGPPFSHMQPADWIWKRQCGENVSRTHGMLSTG